MRNHRFIQAAAILGALAVILGAFGAHALAPLLLQHGKESTYQTAVDYHFYHTMALLLTGILLHFYPGNQKLKISGWLFIAGIVIFSGSLYLLCLTQLSWLGAITPVGGLLFILGWVGLLLAMAPEKNLTP